MARGSYSDRKEILTKGNSEQQEWRKGNTKDKCNKLFFSWILKITFDRSKNYSILNVYRDNIKDDFMIKERG